MTSALRLISLFTLSSGFVDAICAQWSFGRDCQDFRVWAGIMGKKECHYVPTQGAGDSG